MTDNARLRIFVSIKKPDQTLFEDWADAVTAYNKRGVFDILPYHENFISLIHTSLVIHLDKKQPINIPIETGIMKVFENTINILIGIKTLPEKTVSLEKSVLPQSS